jgi:hypothetical protein
MNTTRFTDELRYHHQRNWLLLPLELWELITKFLIDNDWRSISRIRPVCKQLSLIFPNMIDSSISNPLGAQNAILITDRLDKYADNHCLEKYHTLIGDKMDAEWVIMRLDCRPSYIRYMDIVSSFMTLVLNGDVSTFKTEYTNMKVIKRVADIIGKRYKHILRIAECIETVKINERFNSIDIEHDIFNHGLRISQARRKYNNISHNTSIPPQKEYEVRGIYFLYDSFTRRLKPHIVEQLRNLI